LGHDAPAVAQHGSIWRHTATFAIEEPVMTSAGLCRQFVAFVRDAAACLKIVVSPVRVGVSPLPEAPAHRRGVGERRDRGRADRRSPSWAGSLLVRLSGQALDENESPGSPTLSPTGSPGSGSTSPFPPVDELVCRGVARRSVGACRA